MESMGDIDPQALIKTMSDHVSTWGLQVLGGLAVLILGMIAARWIRASMRKALERTKVDPTLVPFLSGIVYYIVVAGLVVAVLGMVGVETTSFIAVLGAAGFAIGLALQGTLANFSSGVMLLFFRPFKVGDYVDAGGTAGTVLEIGIFATTLKTPDNVKIIASNSAIYSSSRITLPSIPGGTIWSSASPTTMTWAWPGTPSCGSWRRTPGSSRTPRRSWR